MNYHLCSFVQNYHMNNSIVTTITIIIIIVLFQEDIDGVFQGKSSISIKVILSHVNWEIWEINIENLKVSSLLIILKTIQHLLMIPF